MPDTFVKLPDGAFVKIPDGMSPERMNQFRQTLQQRYKPVSPIDSGAPGERYDRMLAAKQSTKQQPTIPAPYRGGLAGQRFAQATGSKPFSQRSTPAGNLMAPIEGASQLMSAGIMQAIAPGYMAQMEKPAKGLTGIGHGLARSAEGLATPANMLLGMALGPLAKARPVLQYLGRAVSGAFGVQAAAHAKSAIENYHKTGDTGSLVEAVADAGIGGLAAVHASGLGHHLAPREIAGRIRPTPESLQTVEAARSTRENVAATRRRSKEAEFLKGRQETPAPARAMPPKVPDLPLGHIVERNGVKYRIAGVNPDTGKTMLKRLVEPVEPAKPEPKKAEVEKPTAEPELSRPIGITRPTPKASKRPAGKARSVKAAVSTPPPVETQAAPVPAPEPAVTVPSEPVKSAVVKPKSAAKPKATAAPADPNMPSGLTPTKRTFEVEGDKFEAHGVDKNGLVHGYRIKSDGSRVPAHITLPEVAKAQKMVQMPVKETTPGAPPPDPSYDATVKRIRELWGDTDTKPKDTEASHTPDVESTKQSGQAEPDTEPRSKTIVRLKGSDVDLPMEVVKDAMGKSSKIEMHAALDKAIAEAKARLSKPKGLMVGLPVGELKDLAIIGGVHLAKGAIKFADFSAKMIAEVGDHIKPYLKRIYHASMDHYHSVLVPQHGLDKIEPDIPRPKNMKASDATETVPKLSSTTSAKNVHMAHDVEALGHPELDPSGYQANQETIANAKRMGLHKAGKVKAIRDEVIANPRPLTAEEEAGIDLRQQSLKNQLRKAGHYTPTFGTLGKHEAIAQEMVDNAKAMKLGGTELGRGLAFRKATIDSSYRLTDSNDMMTSFTWRHLTVPTPSQMPHIKEWQAKLDTANTDVDVAVAHVETAVKGRMAKAIGDDKVKPLPGDLAEVRANFQRKMDSGAIWGDPLPKAKRGSKTGAFNVRMLRYMPTFTKQEISDIWSQAKTYIDAGRDLDHTVQHTAVDLGIPPEFVRGVIAGPKGGRTITDAMYLAMHRRRMTVRNAQSWIENENTTVAERAWRSIVRLPFAERVFGHGTVGMVTHAGVNMVRPTSWPIYWRNFGNQFKVFFDVKRGPAFHEAQMKAITSHPNYAMKLRSGLDIDPEAHYDSYQQYGAWLSNLGGKMGSIGKGITAVAERGNMGMDQLKVFRSQYFDREWDRLPLSDQTPERAKLLSNWVNNVSGSGGEIPGLGKFMFAPSLEKARWNRTIIEPKRIAGVYARRLTGGDVSPEEWADAKFRVKRGGEVLATLAGALAANDAALRATGQKDRVNFTDPRKTDFLHFKWQGHSIDPTGGSMGPARLLWSLLWVADPRKSVQEATFAGRTKAEQIGQEALFYGRSKASPTASIGVDVGTQADYRGRLYPFGKASDYKTPEAQAKHAKDRYTWGEYAWENAPIPMAAGAREAYDNMRERGVTRADAIAILHGIAAGLPEMAGIRVSPTPTPPAAQHPSKGIGIPLPGMSKSNSMFNVGF